MRDLNSEKKFIQGLFTWSGTLILVGVAVLFGGALAWIVAEFWGSWPKLTMLLGTWLMMLGLTLAVLTSISRRGLHG